MTRSSEKRKFHHKSRLGCRTCKLRRVKCDETKPACNRCSKVAIACDGYEPLLAIDKSYFDSALEKRSFFYFRDKTLTELDSFTKFAFWDRLVLRQSYDGGAVRAVVAAIGAAHEYLEMDAVVHSSTPTLGCRQNSQRMDSQVADSQQIAAQLYRRALSLTASSLLSMPTSDVLMVMLLMAFLENIQGSSEAAARHLAAARNLIKEYRQARQKSSLPSPDSTSSDEKPASRYARSVLIEDVLDPIACEVIGQQRAIYEPTLPFNVCAHAETIHDAFTSFLDAYDQLYSAAQHLSSVLSWAPSEPTISIHPESFSHRFFLIENWRRRYKTFLTDPASQCQCAWPDAHAHRALAVAYLEIEYLLSRVRLWVALAPSHRKGMALDDDFVSSTYPRILDLCEEIMQIMKSMPYIKIPDIRKCLGFHALHVFGCWATVQWCRDPNLRRKAIAILRAWRFKDRWDTFVIADLAEGFVNLEEGLAMQIRRKAAIIGILTDLDGGLSTDMRVQRAADIPEEARCWFVTDVLFGRASKEGTWQLIYSDSDTCVGIKLVVLRRIPVLDIANSNEQLQYSPLPASSDIASSDDGLEPFLDSSATTSTFSNSSNSTVFEDEDDYDKVYHAQDPTEEAPRYITIKETVYIDRFTSQVLHREQDLSSMPSSSDTPSRIVMLLPPSQYTAAFQTPPRNIAGFFPQIERSVQAARKTAPSNLSAQTLPVRSRRPSDAMEDGPDDSTSTKSSSSRTGHSDTNPQRTIPTPERVKRTNLWNRLQDTRSPEELFRKMRLRILHPPYERLSADEEAAWRERKGLSPASISFSPRGRSTSSNVVIVDDMSDDPSPSSSADAAPLVIKIPRSATGPGGDGHGKLIQRELGPLYLTV